MHDDIAEMFGLAPLGRGDDGTHHGQAVDATGDPDAWRHEAACHPRHKPDDMTIVLISVGWLLVGVVAGAVIEANLTARQADPIPDDPSILVELAEARQDADRWHDEWHRTDQGFREACRTAMEWKRRSVAWERAAKRWHTIARQHETVLAALGRTVAEGGTTLEEAPDA